jgi:hypothetical protein
LNQDAETREAVMDSFRSQVDWCDKLGSPFTASLLRAAMPALRPGGILAGMIGGWPGDPMADGLPLRVTGALHALVLAGEAPSLAAIYPPYSLPDEATLQTRLSQALHEHQPAIERFLQSPPQTNEIGRSAVLLGGFLEIAAATGLPLRLLEIGASAGLNLLWDRFFYRFGDAQWGDPAAPVQLAPEWQGNVPPVAVPVRVASRAGCDLSPVDIRDAEQRLRLRAYVWADQTDRLARLDGAIALGRQSDLRLETANATAFLKRELDAPRQNVATVLYHSIMWHYVSAADQRDITAIAHEAARNASPSAPLGWLRFEFEAPDKPPTLRLTLWPGGEDRHLAIANPHGASVEWLV